MVIERRARNGVDTFAKRLKKMREKRGISKRALAELCGLSKNLITLYENGERQPSLNSLIAIAKYFECGINDLIGDINDK